MPLLSRASAAGGLAMVACVNPQPDDYDETISILSNASLASKIREISNMGRAAALPAAVSSAAPAVASSSSLFKPTESSQHHASALAEKKETAMHKFLRKKAPVASDSAVGANAAAVPQQSLLSKLSSQVGWGKKAVPSAAANAVIHANNKSSRSSTCTVDLPPSRMSSVDELSKDEVSDLMTEINELKRENEELRGNQLSRESEIRLEVAAEMASSTRNLLDQIEELQSKLYSQSVGDVARSVKKARKRQIEISKDQNARDLTVIEEEMETMKAKYESEILDLKEKLKSYEIALREQHKELRERSPLAIVDANSKNTNSASPSSNSKQVGSKRKSVELSLDIVTDSHPFKKSGPPPVNNENRGPPSIFPTVDKSPKFNSSAFRMLRSQIGTAKVN